MRVLETEGRKGYLPETVPAFDTSVKEEGGGRYASESALAFETWARSRSILVMSNARLSFSSSSSSDPPCTAHPACQLSDGR